MIAEESRQVKAVEDIRAYIPVTELHFWGCISGFYCYFIPAPVGLRADSYDFARTLLEGMVSYFTVRLGCHHEGFIQVGNGRDEGAMRLFSINAPKWVPETGLGVWPHRPAPRMRKMEDMENIESPTSGNALLHSAFRVTANANARLDAMKVMTGTGCGLQIIGNVEGAILLRGLKDLFLSFIEDRVFRIFPWYVPLMERAVLTESMERLAVDAMRNISLYIRESPEDGGILIVSVESLTDIVSQLGCKQMKHNDVPMWKLGE